MNSTLAAAELIDVAQASGYQVSPDQLKRLRREGLLPVPEQKHAQGQPGSTSVYPTSAADQLLGVLRLRAGGHRTFRQLRVAAWLDSLTVDIGLLRPDVVASLRTSIESVRRLRAGIEDDQLDARVRQVTIPRTEFVASMKAETGEVGLPGLLLASLQLAAVTPDSDAASVTFNDTFRFDQVGVELVSNLAAALDLPPIPQWPRIISRVAKRWFPTGIGWLDFIGKLLGHPELLNDFSPSRAITLSNEHMASQLTSPTPETLEVRNLMACQGIVFASQKTEEALALFPE